jgi:rhamnogalacturonyl hydrolase YesR
MANAVLKDATFQFVDEKTGKRFRIPQQAPPDAQLRPESPYTDWRYWNGVLNIGMIRLGEVLAEPAYAKFSVTNIAFNFDNYSYFEIKHKDQSKWNYPYGQRFIMEELDDYGAMGASLIEVHRRDPQDRYRAYIDKAGKFILTQQYRLLDSTFVRPFPQKWTLWADDLYMSISFLSRMGELTGNKRYFDDAARQVINFHKYLFNEEVGLMHHCWYSDAQLPGVAFWGRANGWAMMAQVDLLDRIPKNHPLRDTLMVLLRRHILGIARYQSGEGLWHQLIDKTDSYLETSCSAMFIYSIARAVNHGYIDQRYASIAQRGWEGLLSKIHPDGEVDGVCAGTSVSDDLVYYYHRPTPVNDVHGIGVVLLAGAEILQMRK